MKKNKLKVLTTLSVLGFLLITIGVTYAFYSYIGQGTTENVVQSSGITFIYTEIDGQGAGIGITDALPMSDALGETQAGTKNVFNYKIKSSNPTSNKINYTVTVRKKSAGNELDNYIKLNVKEEGGSYNQTKFYKDLELYNNLNNERIIYQGEVVNNANYEKNFQLRMWLSDTLDMSPDQNGNYVYNGKEFSIRVNVYANSNVVAQGQTSSSNYGDVTIVSGDFDTVGSVVKIVDEEFYVIGKEGDNLKLLAKYNLNVGDGNYPNHIYDSTVGLQNENVRGAYNGPSGYTKYGTVVFSQNDYWVNQNQLISTYGTSYPADVYNNQADIATYVNNYVNYLNEHGVTATGRLLLYAEAEDLGCSAFNGTCANAPEWLYQTSFWTGSARDSHYIYEIYANGNTGSFNTYGATYKYDFGVRPVIILSGTSSSTGGGNTGNNSGGNNSGTDPSGGNGGTDPSGGNTTYTLPSMAEMCPGCVYAYRGYRYTSNVWSFNPSNPSVVSASDYETDYNDIISTTHKPYFSGLVLDSNSRIVRAFACGVHGSTPFCIEGVPNSEHGGDLATRTANYEKNKRILEAVFTGEGESCTEYSGESLYLMCKGPNTQTDLQAYADISSGSVNVNVNGVGHSCIVDANDTISCVN